MSLVKAERLSGLQVSQTLIARLKKYKSSVDVYEGDIPKESEIPEFCHHTRM